MAQYDVIGFDFRPDVDLIKLKEHSFTLTFKVKANAPAAKFDVRFIDTKASATDRPWRMGFTVDQSTVAFDGQWREVRIPLGNLVEKGAWDQAWYDPRGLFDWTNVDRFEIVPEHQALTGIRFCYDDIAIVGETIPDDDPDDVVTGTVDMEQLPAVVFPNPSAEGFTIQFHPTGIQTRIRIYNQLGVLVRSLDSAARPDETASVHWDGTSNEGLRVAKGLYIIRIGASDAEAVRRVIVL